MEGNSRPAASAEQAVAAMDRLISLSLVGQHDIAQRLGLNVTDLTCFAHILEAGEKHLTAGELAERANLTTGAVTGVLNRLERAGYARRQADPADRRRVRIVPDEGAVARVVAVYAPFYRRLAELSAGYSAQEVGVLADWFTRAADAMRTTLEEIRRGEIP
ncbi:putative HTH-type transcriptional regulator YcgE [Planobispora rosea]|uniref:Putative HTH-type transcriptional regulator YcgE n=1 Tax=Planobispora rosea TaxID=35762 RepID=A0A8J3WFH9_PLARO|nr:MarR family transcriptional regulator [Planobispora rosea]GGS94311.1 putative HTH-type transcriptional regulator YcgE [Planobispora rosea]GIH87333.1 putative HTH-type transcriptional regulator YcgE [Planobispora rosea]